MRDHYSYFDSSLSPYNFLTVSDRRWKLVNSSLHFQNRLRAADYRRLLEHAGFEIVHENVVGPTAAELELLRRLAARAAISRLHPRGSRGEEPGRRRATA